MVEVERLVLAGILVGGAERLRFRPGLEGRLALPDGVRGIEREVLVLGSFEQMELDEAGDLGELRVAVEPHLLECLLGAFLHPEAVHGDEHGLLACFKRRPKTLESVGVIDGDTAARERQQTTSRAYFPWKCDKRKKTGAEHEPPAFSAVHRRDRRAKGA